MQKRTGLLTDYYYSLTDKTMLTRRNYISYVAKFMDYLNEKQMDANDPDVYRSIKPSDINKYLEERVHYRIVKGKRLENKESIRAAHLYGITSFFEFLISEKYIDSNPCLRVKPPHVTIEKDVVAMTVEEVKQLEFNILHSDEKTKSEKLKHRDLAIIMLGCSTGLRVTSISEINIDDVDFDNNKITVREKGNKEREVYIGQNVKNIILTWIEDRKKYYPEVTTNALFISDQRKRIAQNTIANMIKKYSVGINKHITPHKMRSTCATNLYEKTGDIYLVQSVLGHKNIANTRRYAKMSENRRMEAAKIMDDLI